MLNFVRFKNFSFVDRLIQPAVVDVISDFIHDTFPS
jgi:hypothetical protein